jgi:hypothetical protein
MYYNVSSIKQLFSITNPEQITTLIVQDIDNQDGEGFYEVFDKFINVNRLEFILCDMRNLHEDTFKFLKKLTILEIWKCNIGDLHKNIFKYNTNLTDISIVSSIINNLHENIFYNNIKIEDVNLEELNINNIHENTFKTLKNLKSLYIVNCHNITYLPTNLLKYNHKLKELYLNDNNLTYIDNNFLSNQTHLKELSLSYNKITKLDDKIFENINNLQCFTCYNKKYKLQSLPRSILKFRYLINYFLYKGEYNYIPYQYIDNLPYEINYNIQQYYENIILNLLSQKIL